MKKMTGEPHVGTLGDILRDETRLYGELLALGSREREAIVGRDSSILSEIVVEKEALVTRIARLEAARQRWTAEWCSARGNAGDVALSSVVRELQGEEAATVAKLRESLLARLRDVALMNYQNGQLMNASLAIVNRRIEVFKRLQNEAGYQPSGKSVGSARTAVLDYRV